MFDLVRFADEHSIPTYTEGYKQCQPGWIQLDCPFCTGNPGPHLGWNTTKDYFNCWRCGFHHTLEVIRVLADCSTGRAKEIRRQFKTGRATHTTTREPGVARSLSLSLPSSCGPFSSRHQRFLENRGYDPAMLERLWDLQGTNHLGPYKFRVIAPVYFNRELVSFQGRDVTGRSKLPYKACRKTKEVRDHKHCLYGQWKVVSSNVVVVEGIMDVWRLGVGSVATFGVEYSKQQVELLSHYQKVYILYDGDQAGRVAAGRLGVELSGFECEVEVLELDEGDPGEMSQEDADDLMSTCLNEKW